MSHIPEFKETDLLQIKEQLKSPKRVAILGHVAPDGDALGSTLALSRVLMAQGHTTTVLYPTAFPPNFSFIAGADETIIGKERLDEAEKAIREAEVIFCLDFNEPKRVEMLSDAVLHSTAFKVLIDHHLHPADFTDVTLSYPKVSSTSLLLYHLLGALEWKEYLDLQAGEAIFVGMMTDTGFLTYNSDDPAIYTTISTLLELGIEKDRITEAITRNYTIDKIRLNAHILNNNLTFYPKLKSAIITLSMAEKQRYNYEVGDCEGVVNEPLAAKDIEFSIFLHEMSRYTKVSLRSKGAFPANKFASTFFNGGGHHNAAGAEVFESLKEVEKMVKEAIKIIHP